MKRETFVIAYRRDGEDYRETYTEKQAFTRDLLWLRSLMRHGEVTFLTTTTKIIDRLV